MNQENSQNKTEIFIPLNNGDEVAHYRIIEKIGAGGMGEIYLAEDTKLDRKVALKFLPSSLISNNEIKIRFTREAKAVAKLSHPNIITIYDVGEYKGRPFFAMEYVAGKTLRNFNDDKMPPISSIVDLSIQLCQGLAEAHRMGIVHRDIKSANIIVDKQNRLRILDYGLASVVGSEDITKTGSTLGTVSYMSPEQVSGRSVDKRSDLFSFGVVLYELLTGQLPFKRDNDGATLQALMQEQPNPLTRYRSDIPESLQQIVLKLLEKNLEIRYQSAEGVIADLKRLLYDSHQSTGSVSFDRADNKSIVVVPFSNLSADADNEYFSDGLTEEIITDLSGISDLRVISRSSALLLKGTKKDAPTIGNELNVRYILTGSVRKAGNKVRITSQLVDAVTNQQVWADKYKGTLEDIFEIQEEVSQAIVSNLNLKLTSDEEIKLAERPIDDPKVYELFLRAKQKIHNWNEEDLYIAEKYLKEGLKISGDNALLFAGLAHVYFQFVNSGVKHDEFYKMAIDYASKSLALDPNLPQAHLMQALLTQASDGNQLDCIIHFKKVLELEPNNAEALGWYALENGLIDRIDEGRKIIKKAIALSPLSLGLKGASSFIELMGGNFDKFIEIVEEIYDVDHSIAFSHVRMLFAYSIVGDLDKAEPFVKLLHGKTFFERITLAHYYGKKNEEEKGLAYITDENLTTAKRDGQYSLWMALVFEANKEYEKTIEWLENAAKNGFLNYKFLSEYDETFKSIRDTDRFKKLIASMKSKLANLNY